MKAVVVAGGDSDPDDRRELDGADLLIAADGGATWMAGIGVTPTVLVGDLDSVDGDLVKRLADAGTVVERHPVDKEASDLELAMERAIGAGADRIVVLGALGGERLDHELANLLLLADARWAPPAPEMSIVRNGTLVRALHGPGEMRLESGPGDLVSLLPIAGDARGIRTRGLRYSLDAEPLAFGRSRGLSNEVLSEAASVSLEEGVLLVVETRIRGGRS